MKGCIVKSPGGSRRGPLLCGSVDFFLRPFFQLQAAGKVLAFGLKLPAASGGESSICKEKNIWIRPLFPRYSAWHAPAAGFIWTLLIPCLAAAQPQLPVPGPGPARIARHSTGKRQVDTRAFFRGGGHLRFDERVQDPPGLSSAFSWPGQNPGRDSWTGMDKARHLTASFIITGAAAYWMKHKMNSDARTGLAAGMGFAFSLGIAKEVRDMRKPGNFFSWKDLAADAAGVLAGSLLVGWW
ncbi:hypothetical protein JW906_02600 [bacterium]|nr:hypothetical protein [bacterium]